MRLENKIAVITGASRGMGKAIALQYAQEGAKVVLASRKQESLNEVVSEIEAAGGVALAVATHTGDLEQCENLIAQSIEHFGQVDILVNNAATNPQFGPILDSEPSQWQKIFDVNIMGYFWLAKKAAESMEKTGGGKIINMASVAGIQPGMFMGVYSVSKAAVIMMTKVLALELGQSNIQVNAIAPGIIKTKFAAALWTNEDLTQRYIESTPAGRLGDVEDVVETAMFLAGQGSSYMTGEVLVLDGGNGLGSF